MNYKIYHPTSVYKLHKVQIWYLFAAGFWAANVWKTLCILYIVQKIFGCSHLCYSCSKVATRHTL